MTWTDWFDKLPDEIKLFVSEEILEKNEKVEKISKFWNHNKRNEQASAFRELVSKAKEVRK